MTDEEILQAIRPLFETELEELSSKFDSQKSDILNLPSLKEVLFAWYLKGFSKCGDLSGLDIQTIVNKLNILSEEQNFKFVFEDHPLIEIVSAKYTNLAPAEDILVQTSAGVEIKARITSFELQVDHEKSQQIVYLAPQADDNIISFRGMSVIPVAQDNS